jgi:hypothetical protein
MAPPGAWASCTDSVHLIPDGAEVVLSFDGSFNGDTTVLVVATVDQRPHIDLVELWEAAGTQVAIVDVEQAIRTACRRWRVLEIAADPFRWARSLQLLDGEGLPVLEYPQSPGRMTPATAGSMRPSSMASSPTPGIPGWPGTSATQYCGRMPAVPGWPRNGGTHHGGSTPRWPPSWPTTGPPPWPASLATAFISSGLSLGVLMLAQARNSKWYETAL